MINIKNNKPYSFCFQATLLTNTEDPGAMNVINVRMFLQASSLWTDIWPLFMYYNPSSVRSVTKYFLGKIGA